MFLYAKNNPEIHNTVQFSLARKDVGSKGKNKEVIKTKPFLCKRKAGLKF